VPVCGGDFRFVASITESGAIRSIIKRPGRPLNSTPAPAQLFVPARRSRLSIATTPPPDLSAAVTATGATYCAARTSGTSKSDASL
jgi:hypothetical protein